LTKLIGKGIDLLALFNVDYSSEITTQLMLNPNAQFRLELKKIPRVKK
jgi:hypothetical protein